MSVGLSRASLWARKGNRLCEASLSVSEKVLLHDILERELEGIHDAREMTIQDRAIATADQLNNLMSGYTETAKSLESIKEKLC